MDEIMHIKLAHWEAEMLSGAWNSSQWPRLGYAKCINGVAEAIPGDPLNTFRCKNVSPSEPQYSPTLRFQLLT